MSLSAPAGASATIACSKLSGNINGTIKITGSKCKAKPPKGYGNVAFSAMQLVGGGTLSWSNGDSFTVNAPTTTTPCQSSGCMREEGYDEEDSTGMVTAATSDAYDAQLVGTTYSSRTCVNGAGKITLVKHTKFTL